MNKSIDDCGVIGDLHTVLVGHGSRDWCRLSNFDSSSVFAAMLEGELPAESARAGTPILELISHSPIRQYDSNCAAADGFEFEESTSSLCRFWLVECLARRGRISQAGLRYERRLGYANHLGMYPEEVAVTGGVENFPQAVTHPMLISAAFSLDALNQASRVA